ncbi:MAG: DinB family protein [Phycisphaerales bacterium]|nr:DinB family protein [Phycisphaerales bacterium]
MPPPPQLRPILASQLQAALSMLTECIRLCPAEHWDDPVAKYPFWQVAYHTLCFADCYLSASPEAFERLIADRRAAGVDFHPTGVAELSEEYPSRRFVQAELLAYAEACRDKIAQVLGDGPEAESAEALAGPSGFPRLKFSRTELHIYNARHIQHHAGQLSALLRRLGLEPRWTGAGWRD